MALPRMLIAVPLVVAGIYLPASSATPVQAPPGALGMEHEDFAAQSVTVKCGATLTLVNDSRFIHIIGAGQDGHIAEAAGVPVPGRRLMETDDVYQTLRWNTPGTYYLTCSVHPDMTVKVVVTACD